MSFEDSISRDQIVASVDLVEELERRGVKLIGSGNERTAKCPFHEDGSPSFGVNVPKQVWKCHAGCGGGSVIDLIAKFENRNPTEVFKELASEAKQNGPAIEQKVPTTRPEPVKATISKVYSYRDAMGREVYQVVRMVPKTFRQRHQKNGQWVWNMEDVTRVLYRLPEVLNAKEVWLCEGEKDVETLVELGFEATCNVGGAGKWLDSYTQTLIGKDVVLCGDTDKAGREHIDKVLESLTGKVGSTRRIELPCKDASDYRATFQTKEEAKKAFDGLRDRAAMLHKGVNLPLKTMAEMEASYQEFIALSSRVALDLSGWLPKFKETVRPLTPGDLVFILAGTGVGKTAILQNIALTSVRQKIPTVLFELELSEEALFERFVGQAGKYRGDQVESFYREGGSMGKAGLEGAFPNLLISTESKVDLASLEKWCRTAELKLGEQPRVILLDYIQLMTGSGSSRYEKFSDLAEGLKRMAKSLKAAVIVTSQVKRSTDSEDPTVSLSDGKESGSIENSSSLVLGAWRLPDNRDQMVIRVLKNSKGVSGQKIECRWSPTMRIEQQ